jgi:UDP-N-acetylmuramoylalanine--D-glutamate ligase
MEYTELQGKRVVVMGLGAHGGGEATARYCAAQGARVLVTDLRRSEELREGIERLSGLDIEFVCGEHRDRDFETADLVVKNPAVPRNSPFLKNVKRIETDLSLFLGRHSGPTYGVTGTKGKSTTASALHHILRRAGVNAMLGGNITVSPLTFVDTIGPDDPVVLELSSFQLGDLLLTPAGKQGLLPRLDLAIVTNLLPDHLNYYSSMEQYARDKAVIYSCQRPTDWVLLPDGTALKGFPAPEPDRVITVGRTAPQKANSAGCVDDEGYLLIAGADPVHVLPRNPVIRGEHQRENMLFAAVAAYLAGAPADLVRSAAAGFTGLPHRLEYVGEAGGTAFVNDSAATIPEAVLAAVTSFDGPVHLIAGGSDKQIPLSLFGEIANHTATIDLLEGSATTGIIEILKRDGHRFTGPHKTLEAAMKSAASDGVVLLSPGCASFGMFKNEFDRGDQFRALAREMIDEYENDVKETT